IQNWNLAQTGLFGQLSNAKSTDRWTISNFRFILEEMRERIISPTFSIGVNDKWEAQEDLRPPRCFCRSSTREHGTSRHGTPPPASPGLRPLPAAADSQS
ncbi:hypothetical protein A6R68_15863, partial [Neotoma lepida]